MLHNLVSKQSYSKSRLLKPFFVQIWIRALLRYEYICEEKKYRKSAKLFKFSNLRICDFA